MENLVLFLAPRLIFTGRENINITQVSGSKEGSGQQRSAFSTMAFHACKLRA